MKSDSSSKITTKDHSNLEDDIENTLTLSGHDKLNENDQTQVRLQEFAEEVMIEARTTVQGNHQELLDRKLKSMKKKATVPVAPLRSFEQFAEEVKEEDRATLDNHDEYLEKKLQSMTMDGIVANNIPEDSAKIALMMTGNEPETGTQKATATPGAVAIMGTNIHLMAQSNQFISALNINESTVPESTDTNPHQTEEQLMHYAAATLVVDEYTSPADPPVLANATKIDTQAIEQAIRRRQVKTALVSFVLAIAAAGITYAIYVSTRPENVVDAPNETLTLNPSASPFSLVRTLLANQSFDNGTALSARGSPQYQAFEWIKGNIDGALLNSTANLLQLYSLATLYYATSGFEWNQDRSNVKSTPWIEGMTYCSWGGVACNADGSILTSLDLRNMSLSGSIPIELGHLSGLAFLDVGVNVLRETLPHEIGLLTSLIDFQIDSNAFTGPLPSEIGQLTSLTSLNLAINQFSGSILSEIGLLTDLVQLGADINMFTGILPTEIGKLTSLKSFRASASFQNYDFSGGLLCTEIGLLSNLENFDFAYNDFIGTLPIEIGQLTNLRFLNLLSNRLTGTLPSEIGLLTVLKVMSLRDNNFTGTVPMEIGNMTSLELLELIANQFSGAIPLEIQQLTNLEVLDLSFNLFKGTLPTEIGLLSTLNSLFLSRNQLGGKIPTEIGQLILLLVLSLDDNQFSGTLPTEVGQLNNLSFADFSGNSNLTGAVPVDMCDASSAWLTVLYCPPLACNCTRCSIHISCL